MLNFKKRLSEVKWEEVFDNVNAEEHYNKFIETFQAMYDECIPLKRFTRNSKNEPQSPWISRGPLNRINTKTELYEKYLK